MLYDNALLVDVMSEAYQLTGNELYARTIADTLGFVEREMTDAGGGFTVRWMLILKEWKVNSIPGAGKR